MSSDLSFAFLGSCARAALTQTAFQFGEGFTSVALRLMAFGCDANERADDRWRSMWVALTRAIRAGGGVAACGFVQLSQINAHSPSACRRVAVACLRVVPSLLGLARSAMVRGNNLRGSQWGLVVHVPRRYHNRRVKRGQCAGVRQSADWSRIAWTSAMIVLG